jgi:hypothetical protein
MTPEEIKAEEAAALAAEEAEFEATLENLSDEEKEEKRAEREASNSQDPLKNELEKEKRKGAGRTELEKALYTKQQLDKRIKELSGGVDPVVDPAEDDDKPLTHGDLKKFNLQNAQKTALQLADEIENENERELTRHYLQTRIVPSGDPKEDLRFARSAVNAVKNSQVLEEVARKSAPKSNSSAPGGPAARGEAAFVPTEEEQVFMRAPYNLSIDEIKVARIKNQAQ